MTPEQWSQIESAFAELADLPPGERGARLAALPEPVRAEVESLLAAEAGAPARLEGAVDEGLELLDQPAARRFGPWRVESAIGHGGMGAVYKVRRADASFEKEAALKVVHAGFDSPAALERFRQERQILAGLEHPNIARLLDGGETAVRAPYLVLEYVEGKPITDYAREARLNIRERVKLFLPVCDAVQYAHRNLVVHRDLKPANILVNREGAPKLLDFGIAKLIDPGGARTVTQLMALTPDYASPEQVNGRGVSTATDVYSLGVVLYELLTDRKPYEVKTHTPVEIERVVCRTPPPPARIDADLDNILAMALRKEPERRYATVEQFAADLRRYLDNQPVIARPDTWGYRASKFVRRHRVALIAASIAFVAVAAATGAAIVQGRRAQRRFDLVRNVANGFLNNFDREIRALPGSMKAREMLLNTSLDYLKALREEVSDDPALMSEVGYAYTRAGDVQGMTGIPNLGRVADAHRSYLTAIDLQRRAHERAPANVAIRRAYANSVLRISFLDRALGQFDAAKQHLDLGAQLAEQGLAGKPGADEYRIAAGAWSFRTMLDMDLGDAESAWEHSQRGLRHAEAASKLAGAEGDIHLAMFLGFAARGAHEAGALDEADRLYSREAEVRARIEQRRPGTVENTRSRSLLLVAHADLFARPDRGNLARMDDALRKWREALALLEDLAAKDPAARNLAGDAAEPRLRLTVHSPDLADARRQAALALAANLAMPEVLGQRPLQLARTAVATARLDLREGKRADAARRIAPHLPFLRKYLEPPDAGSPPAFIYLETLADALEVRAEADPSRAAALLDEAGKALEPFAARASTNLAHAARVDEHWAVRGRLAADAGAAAAWREKRLALWRGWQSGRRTNAHAARRLLDASSKAGN